MKGLVLAICGLATCAMVVLSVLAIWSSDNRFEWGLTAFVAAVIALLALGAYEEMKKK